MALLKSAIAPSRSPLRQRASARLWCAAASADALSMILEQAAILRPGSACSAHSRLSSAFAGITSAGMATYVSTVSRRRIVTSLEYGRPLGVVAASSAVASEEPRVDGGRPHDSLPQGHRPPRSTLTTGTWATSVLPETSGAWSGGAGPNSGFPSRPH